MDFLTTFLDETVDAFHAFRDGAEHRRTMEAMAETLVERIRAGHKLMICGNGGSAADSQHIAAEFISRLMFDRAPLPALALTTDSSNLTAIGNDYGYERVFERQVLGLGQEGDILLGISTSGTSKNVLRAFEAAKTKGVTCFAFAGADPAPCATTAPWSSPPPRPRPPSSSRSTSPPDTSSAHSSSAPSSPKADVRHRQTGRDPRRRPRHPPRRPHRHHPQTSAPLRRPAVPRLGAPRTLPLRHRGSPPPHRLPRRGGRAPPPGTRRQPPQAHAPHLLPRAGQGRAPAARCTKPVRTSPTASSSATAIPGSISTSPASSPTPPPTAPTSSPAWCSATSRTPPAPASPNSTATASSPSASVPSSPASPASPMPASTSSAAPCSTTLPTPAP